MAELVVKTARMKEAVDYEVKAIETLRDLSSEIRNVQQALSFNVKSRAQINRQLSALANASMTNANRVKSLATTLDNAINTYSGTEKRVSGNPTGAKAVNNKKSKSKSSSKKKKESFWDYIKGWKFVGEAGVVGKVISGVGKAITGGDPVKGGLDIVSALVSAGGYVAKNVGNSFDWRLIAIGIDKGFSKIDKKPFFQALGDEFAKLKLSSATKVSEKAAVVAKWGGYALTAITTTYENFTDKDNTTFGRRLAESVGESAVKIGGGIAIGAGVAAAFAAAGVAAPAVVVGGVTVGVVWAVDSLFKHFNNGKGAAETISDGVIDFGIAVGKKAQEAGKAISGWWKGLWGK